MPYDFTWLAYLGPAFRGMTELIVRFAGVGAVDLDSAFFGGLSACPLLTHLTIECDCAREMQLHPGLVARPEQFATWLPHVHWLSCTAGMTALVLGLADTLKVLETDGWDEDEQLAQVLQPARSWSMSLCTTSHSPSWMHS